MFNQNFYPTPEALIEQMFKPYLLSRSGKLHILEPSAGKGNIVDYIRSKYRGEKHKIYVIEKDVSLQAILRTKDCHFLHDDFLTYNGTTVIDLIVMNPPFDNGDEHLLKAWEVLEEGDIVCLLNASTIENPYSKTRQILKELIELNGSVEFIDNAFGKAERKTNVRVALVRLKKIALKKRFDFSNAGFASTNQNISMDDSTFSSEVATNDAIGNMVILYDRAVAESENLINAMGGLLNALKPFGSYDYSLLRFVNDTMKFDNPADTYNNFLKFIKEKAWEHILYSTKVRDALTDRVAKDFAKFNDSQMSIDFTKENIYRLLEYLMVNENDMMEKAIKDVFENMTTYNEKNKVSPDSWNKKHKDTWKTNSHYMVNPKVILPNFIHCANYGSFTSFSVYGTDRLKLDDIDKVMCYIMGVDLNSVITILQALNNKFGKVNLSPQDFTKLQFTLKTDKSKMLQSGNMGADKPKEEVRWDFNKPTRANGNIVESTFFWAEYFIKGTLHIHFKYRIVWEQFNIRATKGEKVLG